MNRTRVLSICGLLLAAWVLCSGRQVFEYVDERGERRFTSDARVLERPHGVAAPMYVDPAGPAFDAEEDARSVTVALEGFLVRYGDVSLRQEGLALNLDTSEPRLAPGGSWESAGGTPGRDALRRAIARVELVATLARLPDRRRDEALLRDVSELLFPVLRALYPDAFITIGLHDGIRTLTRAEWDPALPEPALRVR